MSDVWQSSEKIPTVVTEGYCNLKNILCHYVYAMKYSKGPYKMGSKGYVLFWTGNITRKMKSHHTHFQLHAWITYITRLQCNGIAFISYWKMTNHKQNNTIIPIYRVHRNEFVCLKIHFVKKDLWWFVSSIW